MNGAKKYRSKFKKYKEWYTEWMAEQNIDLDSRNTKMDTMLNEWRKKYMGLNSEWIQWQWQFSNN